MEIDPALFQENERLAARAEERSYMSVGSIATESGSVLEEVAVAYETWGRLSPARDNAVLVCHAVSGDSHAIGWWERVVGPGKAIDTEKFFVIGSNSLGGCQGTTGPSSAAPDRKPYGSRFPAVTVGDMVEVQMRLVRGLGIETLHAVAGGSMGGMQALEWTLREPGAVRKAWLTASAAAHSAMQIGFNEAARQAILRDPKWRGGDYPLEDPPVHGLSVARMIGHLSFLSESAFQAKFGRRLQRTGTDSSDSSNGSDGPQYQVESYLNYQGDKFTSRFDANSFLLLSSAIDRYERDSFSGSKSEYLFTSFSSDWLYPTHQSVEMARLAESAGCHWTQQEIELPFGHDSFLLDGELQGELAARFLAQQ